MIKDYELRKLYLTEEEFNTIQKEIEEGYIRSASHPKYPQLKIYNYTDACTFAEHWTDITMMCRGLVVDEDTREVIIRCIPKFFNQGEKYAAKIDFDKAEITLKEDGYMIQFTYHEDYGLIVTSRGSFDSQYANYVYDFYKDYIHGNTKEYPNIRFSYMLELCKDFPGDEGIIVTKHPVERLVWWAVVDSCGDEWPLDLVPIPEPGPIFGIIERVKEFTPDEARKYLTEEVEGVVLKNIDEPYNYERVKVKTEWFLKMHRIISDCTKKRVWNLVAEGTPVDTLEGIPDEFMQQMLEWEKEIKGRIEADYMEAQDKAYLYESWTDRDLGMGQPENPYWMRLIWMLRKDRHQDALNYIIKCIGKNLGD